MVLFILLRSKFICYAIDFQIVLILDISTLWEKRYKYASGIQCYATARNMRVFYDYYNIRDRVFNIYDGMQNR